MPNPRAVAFRVLLKIEQDGAYSSLALNHAIRENKLSGVDSAFVSALVYGVLERKITLDYIIKQYSKIPFRKIETKTKTILRRSRQASAPAAVSRLYQRHPALDHAHAAALHAARQKRHPFLL